MRPIHIILLLQAFICVTIIQSGAPPFPTPEDDESLFRAMFEAQDKYRQDNYRRRPREFESEDWGLCEEKYKWPVCCLWSDKKKFRRGTSDCQNIKGDVILENNKDANLFQSMIEIRQIQGSLVLRNTTILAFGLPNLNNIGFSGDSNVKNRPKASLVIENNLFLIQLQFRQLEKIVKHKSQRHIIIEGNQKIKVDPKQYNIFKKVTNNSTDFERFQPPKEYIVRSKIYELWPYVLLSILLIIVFTHHFIMLEVNEHRVKKKEQEMIDCLMKMRDSTLAAELLLQTPNDVTLAFDTDVLHLCTDQVKLMKQIEKLLNENKVFKDESKDETSIVK
ncbi:Receptor L-domain domain-containing protein [Caenorhabditis elegans]|uniref:Receptor L-domain domain-containing protein n=1 Tax=Caenorhabditis elegans TaxID=6239 RepID=Q94213_CAEEL|nr:Receptor L-domain domain-containing protein [Caenorhabditis elegans]CCD67181.1 Receptor L-domain domain-containing protein [Caenorhabditis elegans]|eukprot:NP_501009.2 Insulin/EGF-Receptor L Domain protein [Caenorhabditis elegans]